MISRVADSIYWMSRYVERAENVARFIDVNLKLTLDATPGGDQQWLPLVNTTGEPRGFQEALPGRLGTQCHPLPHVRRGQPQLDALLPSSGPRERAHGARDHLLGNVAPV